MVARWWENKLQGTDLGWLQDTSYSMIDHGLIYAFLERWHEETSSFHLPFREMTVTLDDVASLLHIPIDGMLLSHESISPLGSSTFDARREVKMTKGAHCQFGYLKEIFKERLKEQRDLAAEYGVTEEVERLRDQAVRIYMLYLVGITIFTDKSQCTVDVVYLKYFRDLDLVSGFSWGAAALAQLYKELNNVARWTCSQVAGYLTLLQV
ncbi:protein MAIN-LIKE 2-like [Medicago truncatula]|nr:protein MAIN-LIKE 2-like [Medicago truncatula]